MKFGKLDDITNIDFSIPEDTEETINLLKHLPKRTETAKIYIGCTGWGMREWVGKIYPLKTKPKDYLKAYAKQFNTIELNTTHYRIPRSEIVRKWYNETVEDFKFCPKIPQSISHSKDLGFSSGKIEIFKREIKGLKEKLGCCFMQLSPYFEISKIKILEHFLGEWGNELPLAIELRHPDWFNNDKNFKTIFKLLETYNMGTVITDVAGRRDVLHQRLTTDIAMIRFVGNGLHPTDYSRIDDWIQCLKSWFDLNLTAVYFFPHEPDNLLAPELAIYLIEQLKIHIPNIELRGPTLIQKDNQMSLF